MRTRRRSPIVVGVALGAVALIELVASVGGVASGVEFAWFVVASLISGLVGAWMGIDTSQKKPQLVNVSASATGSIAVC